MIALLLLSLAPCRFSKRGLATDEVRKERQRCRPVLAEISRRINDSAERAGRERQPIQILRED